MISFGKAASSHSCLIPLKTAYKKKKRRELLRTIASKKHFINLHSAAFVAVFACNLVHAYKFRIIQKTARYKVFLKTTQSRDQLSINIPCKFQEHWKQRRLLNRASNITNCSLRFWVYKCASSLFTGIVFKFHMHVHEYKQGYIRDVKLNSLN